jgi:hypothetical protein
MKISTLQPDDSPAAWAPDFRADFHPPRAGLFFKADACTLSEEGRDATGKSRAINSLF